MRNCRVNLAFANAVVIAIGLGSSRPASPQDAQSWADAYVKSVDTEVTEYLQKHPVRRSLLFDSVSSMLESLGKTQAMAMHECVYEPEFRDWEAVVPTLHENTVVALGVSFSTGKRNYYAATPPGLRRVGLYFCFELQERYAKILHDIDGVGPALVKHGY